MKSSVSRETESTIEFELSAEELLASGRVHGPERARPRWRRWLPLRMPGIAFALGVTLAVLLAGIARQHLSKPAERPRTPAAARTEDAGALEILSTSFSKPAPVRIANPFDSTEVFEFPPGTSLEYARQAVAEFLLDRARERHARRAQRSRNRRELRNS